MSYNVRRSRFLIVLAAVAGCGGDVGFDVSAKDVPMRALPKGATNVHFADHPGVRNPNAYLEFSVSEAAFLAWARRQPNVRRDDKTSFIAYRWAHYPGDDDERGAVVVNDGYCFGWSDPMDGDHGEAIAYDKETGRVYCWWHDW